MFSSVLPGLSKCSTPEFVLLGLGTATAGVPLEISSRLLRTSHSRL
jgi:hypothetical protein